MKLKNFDVNTSFVVKGVAILMMLFHHLFRNGLDICERFEIVYFPFPEKNIRNIASVFKICVAIFTFVSGYGLFLDYNKNSITSERWILKRLIKLLSGFWVIVIFSWIICQFLDGRFLSCYFYDGFIKGFAYIVIEFFGISQVFGTPKFVTEWWYMSAAVTFILLIPLIYYAKSKIYLLLLYIIIFPRILGIGYQGGMGIYSFVFVFVFVLGAFCAKYDIVNRFITFGSEKKYIKFATECLLILLGYKFYRKILIDVLWEYHFGVYPLMIIFFVIEFIADIPKIREILIFLGKHSANIYLIHTIFLYIYMSEFIYQKPHFLISYAIILLYSIGSSIFIEWLKDRIGYRQIINTICRRVCK